MRRIERAGVCALLVILLGCLCWVTYDTVAQFRGWKLEVGETVIVRDHQGELPAVVLALLDGKARVRSEAPETQGTVLVFDLDVCWPADPESAAWKELVGEL